MSYFPRLARKEVQSLAKRFSFYYKRSFDDRWREVLSSLSVFGKVSTSNRIVVYRETEDAFQAMWEEVDKAKELVRWQTYICKDDNVGKTTLAKLEAAHERGVVTELLYDCGGNISGRKRLTERLRALGAKVTQHRPFFAHLLSYLLSGMDWQRSPALRNHRKILLVDRRVGFAGGLNIGDDYCGKSLGGNGRFRDTHCRVEGAAVRDLEEVFDDTLQPREWKFSFTRWRHILQSTIRRQRQMFSSRRAISGSKEAFRNIKELSRAISAKYRQKVKRMTQEHHTNLRPRWLRQRIRASAVREAAAKIGSGTLSRDAMRQRLERWKLQARRSIEARHHRFHCRMQTEALLSRPLLDTDAVPESVMIHNIIPEQTQILMSNPHTRDWSLQLALWHVTRNAHRRVWITTPYYMPHRKLTRAIILAARRGVDVRIMAGSRTTTDPWFMWYASQHLSMRFLREGVRIYEFQGQQIMHAKTVVVDTVWSCVGSYNWDSMSNKNMEVCVTHFGHEVATTLEGHFLQDTSLSVELELATFQRRTLLQKLMCWLAYHSLQFAEKVTFLTYRDSDLTSKLE